MAYPVAWEKVAIRELYEGLYDGPHATPKPSDQGPIFLGIGNITDDGHLSLKDVRHISEGEFGRWTKRVTPSEGDIVFTYEATLNRYAIIPKGFKGCLGRRLALIRPNLQKVDTRFLHYYFFGHEWRKLIEEKKLSGATVDRIPLTEFPTFPVVLPPLETQRRISSILSAYDDLIENNTRRIEILEEMARRLYEEWFVQFRFPGHEGVKFKESELGPIPEGWGVAAVTDVFTIKYGKTFPKTKLNPEGHYPVFGGGGMIGRCDQFNIQGPTTLITSRGNGSGTVWRASETGLVTNNAFIVMPKESKSNVHYGYIGRALLNAPIKSFLGGAAQPQLTLDGLAGVRVLTPDPEVVQQFSALVDPFYALISRIERASANLRAQRDLLLPKLISGEIDVSDIPMPT